MLAIRHAVVLLFAVDSRRRRRDAWYAQRLARRAGTLVMVEMQMAAGQRGSRCLFSRCKLQRGCKAPEGGCHLS